MTAAEYRQCKLRQISGNEAASEAIVTSLGELTESRTSSGCGGIMKKADCEADDIEVSFWWQLTDERDRDSPPH